MTVGCEENSISDPPAVDGKIIGTVKDTNGNLLHDVDIHLVYQLLDIPFNLDKTILSPDSVIWGSFTANINNDGFVELNWSTLEELNNQGFEVQRNSGQGYSVIGFVNGRGTTTEPQEYSFIDSTVLSGIYLYILKQINFDGSFTYSVEVAVEVIHPFPDTLYQNYPNPFSGSTSIRFEISHLSNCSLEIKKFNSEITLIELINGNCQAGGYLFLYTNTDTLPNNLYKIEFKAESDSSNYTQTIFALKNEESSYNLINTIPFIKTVNGKFEINIADIPINKKIAVTSGTFEILKEQIISNTLKFVLYKPGYQILDYDYLIDLNAVNEFNFILENE